MGCDYYIVNRLKIQYDADKISYIVLDELKCYYEELSFTDLNSDDSDYDEEFEKIINERYLRVLYKPLLIFENNNWKNDNLCDKYKNLISQELCSNFDDININKITKEQIRLKR